MQCRDLAVGVAHYSRHPSGIAHLRDRTEWQADAPARIVELHLQQMDQSSLRSFAEVISSQLQHLGGAQITQFLYLACERQGQDHVRECLQQTITDLTGQRPGQRQEQAFRAR